VASDGQVTLADAGTGEARWRRGDVEPSFQWLGESLGGVTIAGPHAVESFAAKDGKRLWRHVPADRTGRWRLLDGRPQREWGTSRFEAFLNIGDGVAFLEDRRDLGIATPATASVDATTFRRFRTLDEPQFQPIVRIASPRSASGSGPVINAETVREEGELFSPEEAERHMVRSSQGFFAAVRNGQVVAGTSWRFVPEESTPLTGAPPQLLGSAERLIALIPRNLGTEMVRIDGSTGRAMWSVPCHELHDGFDVRAASCDDQSVYYPYRGHVIARSMIDGRVQWKQPLAANPGPWQIDRYGDTLVVWPRSASGIPILPMPDTALLAPVALAWGRRGIGSLPITLLDARDGRVRQRIDVPHDGGPVFVWAQGPMLFATAGGKVWAYRSQ
jgi:hypothetical protein